MVSMMQVEIKDHGYENFEYKPESTVNDVRQMASEFLGCKPSQLDVRLRGKGPYLKTLKTLKELDIRPTDILVVGFTKRNNKKQQ